MRRNASILVIDDEEIMREILEALLTRDGYQVRLASTGAKESTSPNQSRLISRLSTS